MSTRALEFVVPGDLRTATGGYGYDRRIIAGLRTLGWQVRVHALPAAFPQPDAAALAHARRLFESLPAGALVLVDGLALGAMPQVIGPHGARLRLLGLVHHPLAAEGGLEPAVARALARSERQALQAVRHVLVTSHATAQALAAYAVAPGNISVVEPGTDEAPLARGRREDAGGSVQLLCVGAVTPRKGHELLIDALAALPAQPWRLTCVGSLGRSPATVARLRAQLHRFALAARVELAGELDAAALERRFLEADLFVLPTFFEGYGMAVAEALAHGVPVISTPVGAIPALVGAQAGLLVPPGDAAALRAVLERVLGTPALLDSMRRGAAAVRPTLPRWEQACGRMSAVLEEVAARG